MKGDQVYCQYCGRQISDDSKYCEFCGRETGAGDNSGLAEGPDSPSRSEGSVDNAMSNVSKEGDPTTLIQKPSHGAYGLGGASNTSSFQDEAAHAKSVAQETLRSQAVTQETFHASYSSPGAACEPTAPIPRNSVASYAQPISKGMPHKPQVAPKKSKKPLIIAIAVIAAIIVAVLIACLTFGLLGKSEDQANVNVEVNKQAVEEAATEHLVVFETNGGTTYEQMDVEDGNIITTPAEPSRPGYAFAGWYGDKDLKTPFEFPYTVKADDPEVIYVYAKWVEEKNERNAPGGGTSGYNEVYFDCIFPQSSNEYLTEADLRGLSDWEVQRAINELYARNGYIFQSSASEKAYFEAQDWYHGNETDQNVVKSRFNAYEQANAKLLEKYRESNR